MSVYTEKLEKRIREAEKKIEQYERQLPAIKDCVKDAEKKCQYWQENLMRHRARQVETECLIADLKESIGNWKEDIAEESCKDAKGMEILDVTLLSIEEAEKMDKDILKADTDCYWLKSKGDIGIYYTACVGGDGFIYKDGDAMDNSFGVRPVLVFSPDSVSLEKGDKFIRGGLIWTVTDKDRALCDKTVKKMPFRNFHFEGDKAYDIECNEIPRNELNDYEKSEVYRYLHTDFLKKYQIELSDKEKDKEEPEIER